MPYNSVVKYFNKNNKTRHIQWVIGIEAVILALKLEYYMDIIDIRYQRKWKTQNITTNKVVWSATFIMTLLYISYILLMSIFSYFTNIGYISVADLLKKIPDSQAEKRINDIQTNRIKLLFKNYHITGGLR